MSGIIGSFPVQDIEQVRRGLARIAHRGPDERRQLKTRRAAFGHTRLAIMDIAESHQPMTDGRRWIIFDGEIYNIQQLRHKLRGAYRTHSDTEVLLKAYAAYGSEMVRHLDGVFAIAIQDGEDLFLARDPIGIKPLYTATVNERVYFASEIKALLPFSKDITEFPPGNTWHSRYGFRRYYPLEKFKQPRLTTRPEPGAEEYRTIYQKLAAAVNKRMAAEGAPVGVSLSGGLDSTIIVALAREGREHLDTFVVGMEGGEDLPASQQAAEYLGTCHHVFKYTFEDMLDILPEVIYYLESYDAALVRSAIPNYFLSRLAADHVKVILGGEGADELFAGYEYLSAIEDPEQLHNELWTMVSAMHNTNLQRTDRMTMAHSIEGRVPFLDQQMVELAFRMPPQWKLHRKNRAEKYLLRRTFASILPESIVKRPKKKFSHGAGSGHLLAEYANQTISDAAFQRERITPNGVTLQSKEELFYYRIFRSHFGDRIDPEVIGRTRSVTAEELK